MCGNWGYETMGTPDCEWVKTLRRKGPWSQGERGRNLAIESNEQGGRDRRLSGRESE